MKPSISNFYGRSKSYYFQQDGASAHTAKSVQAYFEGKKIRVWCARSPELNPIKTIWAWMDRKMLDTKVTSVEQLKEVLAATWESIPRELCMKLIKSMPKRVKMFYLTKGDYFRY